MAEATWSKPTVWTDKYSSAEVVQSLNVTYPELTLRIIKPAQEEVLLGELSDLRDIMHGQKFSPGQLIHLACSAPACGNDGKGKGK